MLARENARELVSAFLQKWNAGRASDDPIVICDEHTIEREFVFAFHYQSRKYLDTGNYRLALYGNRPIIVNRRTGVIRISDCRPLLECVDDYEQQAASGKW
jgi:Immunity protein 35